MEIAISGAEISRLEVFGLDQQASHRDAGRFMDAT